MTDEFYDIDPYDEASTLCPVCLQPWGDIQHAVFVRQEKVGRVRIDGVLKDAMAPVVTCTRREAELKA